MKNKTLPAQSLPISESGADGARHWRQTQTRTGQHLSALRSSQRRSAWSKTDGNSRAESSSSSLTYLLQSVWLTWTSALGLHLEKVVENSDTKFPAHILYPCVSWRSSVDVLWVCWRRRSKFSLSYQLSNLEIVSRGLSWMNPQKCFSRGRNNKTALWFLPFCKTMQAP